MIANLAGRILLSESHTMRQTTTYHSGLMRSDPMHDSHRSVRV